MAIQKVAELALVALRAVDPAIEMGSGERELPFDFYRGRHAQRPSLFEA